MRALEMLVALPLGFLITEDFKETSESMKVHWKQHLAAEARQIS